MQKLLARVRLPDGTITPGQRSEMTLRRRHAKVAMSMDLRDKVVLDIGCDAGLYSLYFAAHAKRVIGIDRNPDAIRIARASAQALGVRNVEFIEGRYQDHIQQIGQCDLAVMWGFLHRVPDIFSLLGEVSKLASAFSLEFQCPVFPQMDGFPMGYYPTALPGGVGNLYGLQLAGTPEGAKGNDGRILNDHFFEPTPALVSEACADLGLPHTTILGFSDDFRTMQETIALQFDDAGKLRKPGAWRRARPHGIGVSRVHMLVERQAGSIRVDGLKSFSVDRLPAWDVGMREFFAHPVMPKPVKRG